MKRRALICGISGQDGCYLAKSLLQRDYEVWGSSRNAELNAFANLRHVGIFDLVQLVSLDLGNQGGLQLLLEHIRPQEIFLLAGQSSVGRSFDSPAETMDSIAMATLNLLEVIRRVDLGIRFYAAGSTECYGDTGEVPANEASPFRPCSPYAVAKASSYWLISSYRRAYGMFACTGILSNHESPLRPLHFVTRKIIRSVALLMTGREQRLLLGNMNVERDWGWAPEYVDAFAAMLRRESPEDYIIATGESHTLFEFVDVAFRFANKHWQDFVTVDEQLMRPTDIRRIRVDPSKAATQLGWRAQFAMKEVIARLLEDEVAYLSENI